MNKKLIRPFKIGDKVMMKGVNDSLWIVFNVSKTHAHIRNIHGVMEWILFSKITKRNWHDN